MDLNGPAIPPPPGQVSNFDDPSNNNGLALGVLTLCFSFAAVCLVLRLYARTVLLKKFSIEEWLALFAFGTFCGSMVAVYELVKTPGYFVHTWDVRLKEVITTTYWVLVFGVCYSVVLPLLKCAILIEWCNFFVPGLKTQSFFWWGAIFIGFVQISGGIAITFALNFQCIPHQAIWDITIKGKCVDLFKIQVASASIQLGSDILMFILPQHIIWNLKLSRAKRAGVAVVFGMGLLAIIAAAFRLQVTLTHGRSADSVYTLGPLAFWATGEMTCGFFIFCVPCIPKIISEMGIVPKIKAGSSFMQSSKKSSIASKTGFSDGSTLGGKKKQGGPKDYYELDEDLTAIDKMHDSTEHLNQLPNGVNIMRTTHVSVTHDAGKAHDGYGF